MDSDSPNMTLEECRACKASVTPPPGKPVMPNVMGQRILEKCGRACVDATTEHHVLNDIITSKPVKGVLGLVPKHALKDFGLGAYNAGSQAAKYLRYVLYALAVILILVVAGQLKGLLSSS